MARGFMYLPDNWSGQCWSANLFWLSRCSFCLSLFHFWSNRIYSVGHLQLLECFHQMTILVTKVAREPIATVEPPSKGHLGQTIGVHCREAVLFLDVPKCSIGNSYTMKRPLWEVVPFSEALYRRFHCITTKELDMPTFCLLLHRSINTVMFTGCQYKVDSAFPLNIISLFPFLNWEVQNSLATYKWTGLDWTRLDRWIDLFL